MSETSLHDSRIVDVLWRANLSDVVNLPKTTTPFTPMLAPLNFGVEPTFGSLLTNTSDGDIVLEVGPTGKGINKFYFYKVSAFLKKNIRAILHTACFNFQCVFQFEQLIPRKSFSQLPRRITLYTPCLF